MNETNIKTGSTRNSRPWVVAAVVLGLAGKAALAVPVSAGNGIIAVAHAAMGVGSGHAAQGYLGVDIRDLNDEQMTALRMKDAHGAEILHVDHDGPAGKAGLREHDVITQMNGAAVEGAEALRKMLRDTAPGKTVTVTFWRDGQVQSVTTQMANREELERQAWEQHWTVPAPTAAPVSSVPAAGEGVSRGFLSRNAAAAASSMSRAPGLLGSMVLSSSYTGAMLEMMGPQLSQFFGAQKGLLVRSVDANSPAAAAGMLAGDIVVRANAVEIATTGDWSKIVHANKNRAVSVVVLRDRHEQTLTLIPDSKRRSSVRTDSGGVEQASRRAGSLPSME